MNTFFRICVAIYSFSSMILFAVIMICPFGSKTLMGAILEYAETNLYQSNKYDVVIFIIGLVFLIISIALLSSGIRGKRNAKYISQSSELGDINISVDSVENIALAMAHRFQGVKDAKAKAYYAQDALIISVRLQVYTEVNIPELCKGIQERVKESVVSSTDIPVSEVTVEVDGVSRQDL